MRVIPFASVWMSAAAKADAMLRALEGRFVPSGASGAPTRGRPEVLPTGAQFLFHRQPSAADPGGVAAWLGVGRALLDRHLMDHGNWPRAVVLSAWGTSEHANWRR